MACAEFIPAYAKSFTYPFVYIRANGNERLLIVINPANREVTAKFNLNYECKKPELIMGKGKISIKGKSVFVKSKPVSYSIYRLNPAKTD